MLKQYFETIDWEKVKVKYITNAIAKNRINKPARGRLHFYKTNSKFNISSFGHKILLLRDIITFFSKVDIKQIQKIFRLALIKNKSKFCSKDFEQFLNALEKLKLVRKSKNFKVEFYETTDSMFFLSYPRTPSGQVSTDIRREIKDKIFESKKLSQDTLLAVKNRRKEQLDAILEDKKHSYYLDFQLPLLYKVFYIPKKNNRGKREIAQPTPYLKFLQKKAVKEISSLFKVHSSATAYIKGKNGIKNNAQKHINGMYFLKLDFEDFFHSIKAASLDKLLKRKKVHLSDRVRYLKTFFMFDKSAGKDMTAEVYDILKKYKVSGKELIDLMTVKMKEHFRLSIGAPSSPYISNIVMYEFDDKISSWCEKKKIKYTRYADDLTFSTADKDILADVIAQIEKILSKIPYLSLSINQTKTKQLSSRQRVTVTGLNITPEHKISVGRSQKKLIRAMLHHIRFNKLSVDKYPYLKGWLSYLKDVEPEHFKSLLDTYKKEIDTLYSLSL